MSRRQPGTGSTRMHIAAAGELDPEQRARFRAAQREVLRLWDELRAARVEQWNRPG